jgi:hypothetical protein
MTSGLLVPKEMKHIQFEGQGLLGPALRSPPMKPTEQAENAEPIEPEEVVKYVTILKGPRSDSPPRGSLVTAALDDRRHRRRCSRSKRPSAS